MSDRPTPRAMWDQRYAIDDYLFGTEPNEFLRDNVAQLPRGKVLCLADGEGRNAVFLAGLGYEVSSIDLSEAGVAKARRLAAAHNVVVDAAVGDLATTELGRGRWKAIVSIFAHLPPKVRGHLHRRVVTALAPGGVFMLEAYTPDQVGRGTGGPSLPEMTMTVTILRDELAGLDFVHAQEVERQVVEGPGHTGTGSVVQVIARRPE